MLTVVIRDRYSTALSLLQPTTNEANVLRRKRARTYLTIQKYDGVLCDAGYKGPSASGPARWDKNSDLRLVAEALYHLGRVDDLGRGGGVGVMVEGRSDPAFVTDQVEAEAGPAAAGEGDAAQHHREPFGSSQGVDG